jgi:hypothetical protein
MIPQALSLVNRHVWVLRLNVTCRLDGEGAGAGVWLTVTHGIEAFTAHSIPLSDLLAPNIPLDACIHPTIPTQVFLEMAIEQLGMSPQHERNSVHFSAQLPPFTVVVDLGSPLPPTFPALGWPITSGFDAITPAMPRPASKQVTVYQAGLECFNTKVCVGRGRLQRLLRCSATNDASALCLETLWQLVPQAKQDPSGAPCTLRELTSHMHFQRLRNEALVGHTAACKASDSGCVQCMLCKLVRLNEQVVRVSSMCQVANP